MKNPVILSPEIQLESSSNQSVVLSWTHAEGLRVLVALSSPRSLFPENIVENNILGDYRVGQTMKTPYASLRSLGRRKWVTLGLDRISIVAQIESGH